jgi:predicted esterase
MKDETRRPIEHTIETRTHGRYLVSPASTPKAALLVGFHGYGETAEEELDRLRTIPSIDHWTVASVQGLHQFYRRQAREFAASWMTRQNRDLAIVDNIEYVAHVVRVVSEEYSTNGRVVFTGFSQGVAMAFRAAASSSGPVAGVIACGGDVPPELDTKQLQRISSVLIGRGIRDEWYTAEKFESDKQRLRNAVISVQTAILDAAHEWTTPFSEASGEFLRSIY